MAIGTIHEARFVLFDDDTRLAFITSFDGPWDAYMDDFLNSGPTLALFDVIFRHVEGYEGLPDMAALQAFILGAQQTAGGLRPELRRHGQGDPQGATGQCRLPAGARRSAGGRGAAAPGPEAAPRRGRRLAGERRRGRPMSDHISGPRALADPIADITDVYAFPSPERPGHLVLVANTLPFAQPSDALLGRARLPLPAAARCAAAPPATPRRSARARTSSSSTASSPSPARTGGSSGTCTLPTGDVVGVAVGDEQGGAADGVRVFAGAALGPVHPRRPRRPQDDRDRAARVHGRRLDLPRRQERPRPRRRARLRAVPRRTRRSSRSWRRRARGAASPCASSASGGRRSRT